MRAEIAVEGMPPAEVLRFDAVEHAGRPSSIDVEVIFAEHVDLDDLIARGARLAFSHDVDDPRVLSGIIASATGVASALVGESDPRMRVALAVVSPLALLGGSVGYAIYQDKTVPEIVAEVLRDHGVDQAKFKLTGSYPKRPYCVRYGESALAFVMRLCEHEGIYCHHDAAEPGDLLIFADNSPSAPPIEGLSELAVVPRSSLSETTDAIYAVRKRERVRSGKFVLRDFDFEKPALDLTTSCEAKERTSLEVYDYPGGYVDPGEGQRLARVRLEAEQVERRTVAIEAMCPRLAAGRSLTITGMGDYFIFEATHSYVVQTGDGSGGGRYSARARLMPLDVPYRPARETPIPFAEGPETARVVAPEGSQPEAICTDEHGRCKVKFAWDMTGVNDDKASCWMRVAQLQTSGSMMLPRVGWEVIVEYVGGDPDRPIVTGRVYNAVNTPPYSLPEGKTRTAVKTASTPGGGGSNEIRFEDKAGAEEIFLHAQRDMRIVSANDASVHVGNCETVRIGNDASLDVGANQTIQITKGLATTVGGAQNVFVGGDRSVEVNAVAALTSRADTTIDVSGDQMEMIGSPLEGLLALAAQAAEEFVSAMADKAIAKVKAEVEGAIDQVMSPIQGLADQAQEIAKNMEAVANGDLSAVTGAVAAASGIPGAGALAAAMAPPPLPPLPPEAASEGQEGSGGGGGDRAMKSGAPDESPTNAAASFASKVAHDAVHQGMSALTDLIKGADNTPAPEGDVPGIDAEDRQKGPGHRIVTVEGAYTESVGSARVTAALSDIAVSAGGDMTISTGAALVDLAIGHYNELVEGNKTESALGLIALTKGGESEAVSGEKTTMVGGAIVDKIDGGHAIEAAESASFIGAFHKIEAAGTITLKCGESEVVIGEDGVSITSPLVTILSPKIQLTKSVTEV